MKYSLYTYFPPLSESVDFDLKRAPMYFRGLTERTKGNNAEAVFRTVEENLGYQEPIQAMRISTLQTMAYRPSVC